MIRQTLGRVAIVLFMLGLLACVIASIVIAISFYISVRGLGSGP